MKQNTQTPGSEPVQASPSEAPAFVQADGGIAFGAGTDVVIESAGFTLLNITFDGILRARRLSHAVVYNMRENLFFALNCNARSVLFVFPRILTSLVPVALAMSVSSISVVVDALRLWRSKFESGGDSHAR